MIFDTFYEVRENRPCLKAPRRIRMNYGVWRVSCGNKTYCLHEELRLKGGDTLHGGLSKGPLPVFARVLEKTSENSEFGRKARPRMNPAAVVYQFECRTSRPLIGRI